MYVLFFLGQSVIAEDIYYLKKVLIVTKSNYHKNGKKKLIYV